MSPSDFRARRIAGAAFLLLAPLAVACSDDAYSSAPAVPELERTVVTASGDVAAKVAEFRTLLGDPANGGAPGEQAGGRREIGWDGAGANPFNNRDDFPGDFFNVNATNGVLLSTPGTGLRNDSLLFVEIDASYAAEFATFTPSKIFAPIGSRVLDVTFRVAGENTPALVHGFGAVFSDVDVAQRTTIEYYDEHGRSLGVVAAPVRSDAAGLSFAGVRFEAPVVARVRMTLGDRALAAGVRDISAGGPGDLVVVDNFLYDEPRRARAELREPPALQPIVDGERPLRDQP